MAPSSFDPGGALLAPLRFPFMVNGLVEVLLLGLASGVVGAFVVQRNLTFFAHALSHTIFPGLVLATVVRLHPIVGALAGVTLTLLLVLGLGRRSDVGHDSAVGIVFVGLFALGVVLVGLFHVRASDLGAAVVGNLLGVRADDLALSSALLVGLLLAVGLLYRPLVLATFDPLAARAQGLPMALLDGLVLAAVAGTAVVGAKVVGVILTVAVLVTPAAAARLWARRLSGVMLLAAGLGSGAGAVGLYVAYYAPVAPAAVIVLLLGGQFAASSLLAQARGRTIRGEAGPASRQHPAPP